MNFGECVIESRRREERGLNEKNVDHESMFTVGLKLLAP